MKRLPLTSPDDVPFRKLDGPAGDATVFSCPLCASRFTHGLETCGACPLSSGCKIITCPSCGYTFPRSSSVVDWVRRLFTRDRARSA